MPCRDGGPSIEAMKEHALEKQRRQYQAKINGLTAMLCSACTALEQKDFDFSINPKLDEWWSKHKADDLKRKEKEATTRLKKEEALEISKKPFKELTAEDKKKLKSAGLL